MNKQESADPRFALCLDNENYPASLEVGKVYRVIPDEQATEHGYLRVIDESGEDYAYTAERFFLITLPQPIEEILLTAAGRVAA